MATATGLASASAVGTPALDASIMLWLLEDAVRAWVKTATKLPDAQIFFANQKIDRPSLPYITIRVGESSMLGVNDAIETDYDAGRAAGSEIAISVVGEREVTVYIQAFNCPPSGNGSAMSLMSRLQIAQGLPSVTEAFAAAGASLFDVGQARDLTALLGTDFDGRATIECRFYVREFMREFTTWISEVRGTFDDVPYTVKEP